jgi:hypothetical protein
MTGLFRCRCSNCAGTVQFVGATDQLLAFTVDEVSQAADGRIVVDQTLRVLTPPGAWKVWLGFRLGSSRSAWLKVWRWPPAVRCLL